MKKKIMVTGAAGFIGSNLCRRLLTDGYEVVGIDNLAYGVPENIASGVDFYRDDIRNKSIDPLFNGVDTVFHLAAKNCLADCLEDPLEASDINVRGTVNVLEAAKKHDVRKFIYADSSAVYEGVYDFPSAVDKVRPTGAYGVSKHAGSLFAAMYRELLGLNVTALRYFCVYGPAQDYRRTMPPLMSAFILKLLKGERPVIYGDGEKRRDFIHVNDVNDFHLQIIDDDRSNGRTFNLGTGYNFSVREILSIVGKRLGVLPEPLYEAELPGEAEITLADISSSQLLGWNPKVDIETGIDDSINFLRRELKLEINKRNLANEAA